MNTSNQGRKHLIACLVTALASCPSLWAHQDTIIRLEGKTLVGLPGHYSPAELDLEDLRLRIGRRSMVFSWVTIAMIAGRLRDDKSVIANAPAVLAMTFLAPQGTAIFNRRP